MHITDLSKIGRMINVIYSSDSDTDSLAVGTPKA